jgi:nucleotide-binding universal stress UspA family protein
MFQTIVVGVDGRPGGRDALAFAALLQRTFGAGVIAVVAYPHDELVSRAGSPAFEVAIKDEAVAALDAEIVRSGIDARAIAVADASPPRALHQIAEAEGADLIVVGSDDRGPIGHVLAGDVTAGTLYASPCAVAVAPHGFATTEPVLRAIGVGYDESAESQRALELARAIAEAAGATLELVGVVAPLVPVGPWMVAPVTTDDSQSAEHERLEELVADAAQDVGERTRAVTVQGLPADELAARSAALDLMVMGSRGYGPAKRLILGSTARKLVRSAACPVIVLPRGAHDPELGRPVAAGAGMSAQPGEGDA